MAPELDGVMPKIGGPTGPSDGDSDGDGDVFHSTFFNRLWMRAVGEGRRDGLLEHRSGPSSDFFARSAPSWSFIHFCNAIARSVILIA
jgi:hypothetical protein